MAPEHMAPVPTEGEGAICASMLQAIPALVGRADGRGDGQDIAVISWIGMVHISLVICRQRGLLVWALHQIAVCPPSE